MTNDHKAELGSPLPDHSGPSFPPYKAWVIHGDGLARLFGCRYELAAMTHLELVPCASEARWQQYLAELPWATVFHRLAWLKLVARISGSELQLYEVSDRGNSVGLFPLFLFRRGPAKLAASPPPLAATPYLGPAVAPGLVGAALNAAAAEAKRQRAVYAEFRLGSDVAFGEDQPRGFEVERRSTFILDLSTGVEALWSHSLEASCRRAIRKAQKNGVTIEEVQLEDIVERYYAMAAEVFAKYHRPPPLSRAQYSEIAATLKAAPLAKVFVARYAGEIVSAGIFPFDERTVYYLDGVSSESGLAVRPNNLLHWEVICWAVRHGIRKYDMVGAGVAGVARFKRTFGPLEMPYHYCYRALNPLAAVARRLYAFFAPTGRAVRYFFGTRLRRKV